MKHEKNYFLIWKVIFISAILLILSFSAISIAEPATSTEIEVTYSFNIPLVEKIAIGDVNYDKVTIPGILSTGNPGEPSLPIKGAYILLPQKTKTGEISVTYDEKILLGDNYNIVPVGKPVPIMDVKSQDIPIPNEIIYNSNEPFPGKLFTEIDTYSFRGYEILVLELYPVQYIPASGEVYYYSNFKVTLNTVEEQSVNPLFRGLENDRQEVLRRVDNPNIVDTYTGATSTLGGDDYDLLIITTDGLKDGFEPLKTAHDTDGTSTIIKTLSDIGGSSTEDIRDYIRTFYNDFGIEYVLLGGDGDVVTERILWVFGLDEGETPYETYMPSDLYYGCLDGTYNYDSDDKWGEPTDGDGGGDVDLFAEVYVGRACVGNLDEVGYFVDKTISYMQSDDEYLDEALLVGEHLGDYGVATWGGNYLDQLIDDSSDDGYTTVGIPSDVYTIDTLYDRDDSWSKSELIALINNGIHIINHLGHSNYDYNMKMGSSDVYSLSNNEYCFIYSQGCMAGGFDQGDCIAEYFTVKTENAAFAVIMNARYGWFWSYSTDGDSQRFQRQFWDAVFGEDIPEIGRANQDSKEDNLYIIERSCIRWCYYQLNLFGDPSLSFLKEPYPHPEITIGDVTGGLGVNTMIKNVGDADATGVEWTIEVTGGIFNLINKTFSGTIPELVIDEEVNVDSKIFLGLGKINITITARCNEGSFTEETEDGKQVFFITKIT